MVQNKGMWKDRTGMKSLEGRDKAENEEIREATAKVGKEAQNQKQISKGTYLSFPCAKQAKKSKQVMENSSLS